MSDIRKSVFSAVGVVASVAAIVVGLEARQHADVGALQNAKAAASIERMLASNSDDDRTFLPAITSMMSPECSRSSM